MNSFSKQDYVQYHKECCDRMHSITLAKNADYTGGSEDPFANFRRVELMGVTNAETGFLTRMLDKFSRITSFVHKGILYVKDESIEDTLLDLANYCILFAAFIKSKKQQNGADNSL